MGLLRWSFIEFSANSFFLFPALTADFLLLLLLPLMHFLIYCDLLRTCKQAIIVSIKPLLSLRHSTFSAAPVN